MSPLPSGPHPVPSRPGPEGARARVAGAADHDEIATLLREYHAELRESAPEDHLAWAVQAIAHDPLRGLFVVAETATGGEPCSIGLAAFTTAVRPRFGWSAELLALYVRPTWRESGLGRWLLAEALEAARYHGMNHVECLLPKARGAAARFLEAAGFEREDLVRLRADLHPLYDDLESGEDAGR